MKGPRNNQEKDIRTRTIGKKRKRRVHNLV